MPKVSRFNGGGGVEESITSKETYQQQQQQYQRSEKTNEGTRSELDIEERKLSKMSDNSLENHTRDSFWLEVEELHRNHLFDMIEKQLKRFFQKYIMDRRTYLTKQIEANEQYFQLLIDIMMYCKYKILCSETSASDQSLIDLLKKAKSSIIRQLNQPEFKSKIASMSIAEELKYQASSHSEYQTASHGYQTNHTNQSNNKVESFGQTQQLLHEYDNMENTLPVEDTLEGDMYTNLREFIIYKDFSKFNQKNDESPDIDNLSQQVNFSLEGEQQKIQSSVGLLQMLDFLTMIGALLLQVGGSVECEECYVYYIMILETIYGRNSLKLGQAFYLMGLFYDELEVFNKATIFKCKNENTRIYFI